MGGVSSVGNLVSVQSAIALASSKTGVDFNYLIGQAHVESGLRTNARAATSSATGLYQFIDQSWLGVVKEHGAEHGLGWAADSIKRTANGRYMVSDPATRRAILNLRNDPQAASLMAAEHAADNKASLETSLGRATNGTDLYMAHFLGLGGARSFLKSMDANPDRAAAGLFPAAARANRGIFYASNGRPRTLQEVYNRMAAKLDKGAAAAGATGNASAPLSTGSDWNALIGDGADVVVGNGASNGDAGWINTTIANLNQLREPVNPMRPTPETAKLAYMMLASLGS